MARRAEGPISSYRELALFVGLALPALFLTMGAVHVLVTGTPLRGLSKPLQLMLPQLAGYGAALGVLALMVRVRDEKLLPALRWSLPPATGSIAIAAGLVIAILTVVASALLRTPPTENPMQALMEEDPISMAIAAVTMAPICEEIFFRGVLQPLLVRDAGVFGIFLAALPFALLHGPEYAWSWRHVLLVTLAGAAFGLVRHRTGSTGAAAIAHAAYNGLLMIFYLFGRMQL